jgi:hypothetical protein
MSFLAMVALALVWLYLAWQLWMAFAKGRMHVRWGVVEREAKPGLFWGLVALHSAVFSGLALAFGASFVQTALQAGHVLK